MKVSILCTAFNHEKYIADALSSFVCQKTDFPYEILVTDDASTDSTPEIIRSFAEKYPDKIRYFHQEENLFSQGINIFPHLLFKEAKGEYYAWCEGDDYWTDDTKLQQQVDFLDSHPEYSGCVHNSMYHFCEGNRPDELVIPESSDRDINFSTIITGMSNAFHTSSILVRASVINPPPDYYNTAFSYGFTDYAIAIRMALSGKVRFIDKAMSVYRRTSNDESWSSGYHHNYGKLIHFVKGEIAMMETLLPHLDSEKAEMAKREIIKRRYELYYLQGDVEKLLEQPYKSIFTREPFSFRLKTRLKILFPGLHKLYRNKQGYKE